MNYEKEKKPLVIKYGQIYNALGIGIDNLSIIVDKTMGLYKYGDAKTLGSLFSETIKKYNMIEGWDANDLTLINFDKYDGCLNTEEICAIVNHFILCSNSGDRILEILNYDEHTLKEYIKSVS